ncbi:MAG: hypothetical protein EA418_11020 [Wenzhouxiangellaceae bacterium]|nr:MAG: hypothetical protein EA418_11020 [Wenzhouxiangellaceae bacterium]
MNSVFPTHHDNPLLYAGFWKRLVAYMVDGIIRMVASIVILLIAAYLDNPAGFLDPEVHGDLGLAGAMGTLVVLLMYLLYHPLFEASRHQATPGKMLLGIIVTDAAGQRLSFAHALGRHLASAITWMTSFLLYFGYWMAGITARKQALHDLIANCLVINRNAEIQLPKDVHYVSGGFPIWAAVLVGLVLLVPVTGILAAIAIPAYMHYLARATVATTINETVQQRALIVDHFERLGFIPASQESFGQDWLESISEGKARVALIDRTLVITFTERAPMHLQGQTIGMSLHGELGDQLNWHCGLSEGQGRRHSRHSAADMTSLEARMLPSQCR